MARDPTRIPRTLRILQRAWERNPDLRLGQLLQAAAGDVDPFYLEEEDWDLLLARMSASFPGKAT